MLLEVWDFVAFFHVAKGLPAGSAGFDWRTWFQPNWLIYVLSDEKALGVWVGALGLVMGRFWGSIRASFCNGVESTTLSGQNRDAISDRPRP